jgi:hypothetical protein
MRLKKFTSLPDLSAYAYSMITNIPTAIRKQLNIIKAKWKL